MKRRACVGVRVWRKGVSRGGVSGRGRAAETALGEYATCHRSELLV